MGRTAWLQGRTTHVLTTQPPFAIGIAGAIAYMTVLQHWVAHPMADAEKYLSAEADDHFHDECGVFGIFGHAGRRGTSRSGCMRCSIAARRRPASSP